MSIASSWHRARASHRPGFLIAIGSAPLLWSGTAAVIALSVVLGGGTRQGLWSDALVQIASLGLLLAALAFTTPSPSAAGRSWDRLALFLLAAIVALPVIQLLPLPPALWTRLPGRADIVADYTVAGLTPPWLPISLDPQRTLRSALSLLPGIAVVLATVRLDFAARRSLSLVYVGLAVIGVFLGLAQLAQGPGSPLRFFPITNPNASVGFFANRNHYAALLYSIVPFVAAWVVGLTFDRRVGRLFGLAVCVLVFATLMLGLGMAQSRAGIFLAALAGLSSLGLAAVNQTRFARYGVLVIAGAWLLGLILIVQYALFGLLSRFDTALLADLRFDIARVAIDAGLSYQPIGSGFGTFEAIYQMFEPVDILMTAYVNHAHNDWLELWLEGGWVAVLLMLLFVFWFARASFRVWREPIRTGHALDRALPQAATVTISLLLLHAAVDYPLRTTTLITLFAWSCALLVKPISSPTRRSAGGDPSRSAMHSAWTRRFRHNTSWRP